MSKMPLKFIRQQRRTLEDLLPGDRARFPLYGLRVDLQHDVFAILNAELDPVDDTAYAEIWRDLEGAYHLDLRGQERQWKPSDLEIYHLDSKPSIVPISSLIGFD